MPISKIWLDRAIGTRTRQKQVEGLLDSAIDYEAVQEKLQSLREHSFEVLKAALS